MKHAFEVERRVHGVLVTVPIAAAASRAELLPLLLPEEAALTTSWADVRLRTFAAGRVALREAAAQLGVDLRAPILPSARGAPLLPDGVRGSISHKDDVAIALATFGGPFHVGVDIETLTERRSDVSRHVLTAAELSELAGLDVEARRHQVLVRFSLKEALYKALDPFVQRYVGFLEVEVRPQRDGTAQFNLSLAHHEGPFSVEASWQVRGDVVVTTARVVRP